MEFFALACYPPLSRHPGAGRDPRGHHGCSAEVVYSCRNSVDPLESEISDTYVGPGLRRDDGVWER
jgi:hypothetical protein